MRILVVGLGSIGKRHLNNLISLGYRHIGVVSRNTEVSKSHDFIEKFDSLESALSSGKFDAVILCTPTAFHIPAIKAILTAQVKKVYIEKPVSHNLEGLAEVFKLAAKYSGKIIVGYDLHFDPGLQKVRELLKEGIIGKPVSANSTVGQYLPNWRPHEDYRQGMSAKISTGGGVMLDLVHEFDYLYWLFGAMEQVGCFYVNSGALEIETEDSAEVILKFKSGVLGSIHFDYLQRKLVRNCRITGSNGSIFWDIASTTVSWITESDEAHFSYGDFNRNDRFIAIMRAFLQDDWDERLTSLQSGAEGLRTVIAAKVASQNNVIISPESISYS